MYYQIRLLLFVGVTLISLVVNPAIAQSEKPGISQVMQNALASLTHLVEVSLGDGDRNSAAFNAALKQLELASIDVGEHTHGLPYSFDLVARSLEDTVSQMVRAYTAGLNDLGEIYLVETFGHCAACHAQSPTLEGSTDVGAFVDRILGEDLESSVAAQLLVAVRRKDEAISLWENRITGDAFLSTDPGSETLLLEYLSAVIHLDGDLQKAAGVFDSVVGEEGVPYYLSRKIGIWNKQIDLYASQIGEQLTLDRIDNTIAACEAEEGRPLNGSYPVCRIIDSALSARMLGQSDTLEPKTESTLYLNIGVSRMNSGLSVGATPRIENFLEAAILASPATPVAQTAYAHLEELAYLLFGGVDLADDVLDVSIEGLRNAALSK